MECSSLQSEFKYVLHYQLNTAYFLNYLRHYPIVRYLDKRSEVLAAVRGHVKLAAGHCLNLWKQLAPQHCQPPTHCTKRSHIPEDRSHIILPSRSLPISHTENSLKLGPPIFQKPKKHDKFLVARKMTRSKFHTKHTEILRTTA